MNLKPWKALLAKFAGKRIAVLGDMMLDEYVYGETARISREAPVLILKYGHTEVLPGGGANPVSNIHSLGGQALPVGVTGDDAMGARLRAIFAEKGLDTTGLVGVPALEDVQPKHGDLLVVDGTRYKVQGPPQWASRGLVSTPPRYRWCSWPAPA